ncbi:MAG: transcription antitermination factor NusB [Acidimicrobiaceae bacterium]|nr:transcription antitermination factor NusB [Acidimicrobiaceae bacterium]
MPEDEEDNPLETVADPNDDIDGSEDWVVPIVSRREGRERVISLLYELEMKNSTPEVLLDELTLTPDPFVTKRFLGISNNQSQLNTQIMSYSQDWDPSRMPVLDHSIIQLALFELIFCPEVPTGVILSEAVELAQKFSTESSGKFINGLLSAAAKHIREP